MTIRRHTNNYASTLNGAINSSVTSLVVTSATGLPTLSGSDSYNLTLDNLAGTIEIVTVTAASGATLTVTRGAESTSATSWANGAVIQLRPTADGFDRKADLASPTFTGTVALPSTTSIGTTTSTELGYVHGVTSSIQTQINAISGGSGITALTGDVTASGSGSVAATIPATTVTYAKMQNVSATARILGRNTAGAGSMEELTASTVKTMLSLNNVENTALSTWAGTTNITTLGTIATGTWHGTSIDKAYLYGWDTNGGLSANNFLEAYTTTATAAGTTTLTVASTKLQYFTGVTTQTVVLPVTSTLVLGHKFIISNSSTGAVTVQSSGANTIVTIPANCVSSVTCVLTSGTSAASWGASTIYPAGGATNGKRIKSDGTNWVASATTMPDTGTSGKSLVGDGTNYTEQTVIQSVSSATGAVSTGTTLIPADDTIPQNTEGDQVLTVSITPTNSSSKLIIRAVVTVAATVAGDAAVALFQDSTANALACDAVRISSSNQPFNVSLLYQMTAGTTSSTTFNIRIGNSASGTVTINGTSGARLYGGVLTSILTVQEVIG